MNELKRLVIIDGLGRPRSMTVSRQSLYLAQAITAELALTTPIAFPYPQLVISICSLKVDVTKFIVEYEEEIGNYVELRVKEVDALSQYSEIEFQRVIIAVIENSIVELEKFYSIDLSQLLNIVKKVNGRDKIFFYELTNLRQKNEDKNLVYKVYHEMTQTKSHIFVQIWHKTHLVATRTILEAKPTIISGVFDVAYSRIDNQEFLFYNKKGLLTFQIDVST